MQFTMPQPASYQTWADGLFAAMTIAQNQKYRSNGFGAYRCNKDAFDHAKGVLEETEVVVPSMVQAVGAALTYSCHDKDTVQQLGGLIGGLVTISSTATGWLTAMRDAEASGEPFLTDEPEVECVLLAHAKVGNETSEFLSGARDMQASHRRARKCKLSLYDNKVDGLPYEEIGRELERTLRAVIDSGEESRLSGFCAALATYLEPPMSGAVIVDLESFDPYAELLGNTQVRMRPESADGKDAHEPYDEMEQEEVETLTAKTIEQISLPAEMFSFEYSSRAGYADGRNGDIATGIEFAADFGCRLGGWYEKDLAPGQPFTPAIFEIAEGLGRELKHAATSLGDEMWTGFMLGLVSYHLRGLTGFCGGKIESYRDFSPEDELAAMESLGWRKPQKQREDLADEVARTAATAGIATAARRPEAQPA